MGGGWREISRDMPAHGNVRVATAPVESVAVTRGGTPQPTAATDPCPTVTLNAPPHHSVHFNYLVGPVGRAHDGRGGAGTGRYSESEARGRGRCHFCRGVDG